MRYEYDIHGHRITMTDPEGHITRYAYDALGNQSSMTDGNDHVWQTTYDAMNRPKTETDPLGFVTETSYDGDGKRTEVKKQVQTSTAPFQVTQFRYDFRNRIDREIRDPGGLNLTTSYAYDRKDNRVQMTDPRLKTTHYAYDVQNRLVKVTDALAPLPDITEYRYDGVDNRSCVIDANGHFTFYEYDALSRMTVESRKFGTQSCTTGLGDPDDLVTRTFYDTGATISPGDCQNPQCAGPIPGSGSPAFRIDPKNKFTYFKYDRTNRAVMTIRKVGDTADDFDATGNPLLDDDWSEITRYDDASNVLARIDANDNPMTYTYFLDNLRQTEANALGETTRYTYDAAHNLETTQSPGGNTTTNVYNVRNELIQVFDLEGPVAGSDPVTLPGYRYDGVGNRLSQCDGNDHCTKYQYDLVNRLTGLTDALVKTTRYVYDPAGNLIQTTDRDGKVMCSVYDDINRRIREVRKVGDSDCTASGGDGDADDVWTKIVYDKVGNVAERTTAKTDGGGTPAICNGASGSIR